MLHGVGIVGHPVARRMDDGLTVEIYRVCTDGTYNACSMLYGACARIAREMGYKRIITYTLVSEPGSNLKASGFTNCGEAGGTDWNVPSRPRETVQFTLFGEERKYPDEKNQMGEKIQMNGDKLRDAINRTFGKPPIDLSKEKDNFLVELGFMREGTLGYEVSEEDWAVLDPLLYAKREEIITFQGGNKLTRVGTVLLVAHITLGCKNFIKVEDGRKDNHEYIMQYLLDIVDVIRMCEERPCSE